MKMILIGYKDSLGRLVIEPFIEPRESVPLIFTREVSLEGRENSRQESGYRANKYQYDPEMNTSGKGRVDYPLLRMGDVYLLKAESLLRKGQTGDAINVINELRNARGAQPITS